MDAIRLPEEGTWINTDHMENTEKPNYLSEKIASIVKMIKKGEATSVFVQGHITDPKNSLELIVHLISKGIFATQIDQKKIDKTLYLITCTTPEN
ncbi:MAG TPA: hypothetical protein P5096_01035 [Patescibacteria group bacterium]|nr:hypothetical protein [Patescibacteria group bacterium]